MGIILAKGGSLKGVCCQSCIAESMVAAGSRGGSMHLLDKSVGSGRLISYCCRSNSYSHWGCIEFPVKEVRSGYCLWSIWVMLLRKRVLAGKRLILLLLKKLTSYLFSARTTFFQFVLLWRCASLLTCENHLRRQQGFGLAYLLQIDGNQCFRCL